MKFASYITALFMTLLTTSALAIQGDRIKGEVLSVDADERTMRIEILEVGANVDATVGTRESYSVPADVPIEFEIDGSIYQPYPEYRFTNIAVGDEVLLDFTNLQRTEIARIRTQETKDLAVRERVRREGRMIEESDRMAQNEPNMDEGNRLAARDNTNRRSALPDSASALPGIALLGLLFAVLAVGVRYFRS